MATAVAGASVRKTVSRARLIGWAIHDAGQGLFDPRHDIVTCDAADVRNGRPLLSCYVRRQSIPDAASDIHLYDLASAGPRVAEKLREFAGELTSVPGLRRKQFADSILAAADRIECI